ncbi:hypothetical protein DAPPUDRAFT_237475 [Daphnia pulex]|uniref:Uncharacterized protein n=1 Tax=Daphnia pulex TaxID=6669 RepID=E9G3Y6_DAPPU|nr:hypothetical protein DAPPUDRAFT_237475 [Daphnia pulex]|eukprot:EFX85853.1 hypothetical protein DAPPUDRAFT_237475 [Daphnia pulex]
MTNKYVSHFTCLFLFPLLSITCGSSIRSSLTAEENPFLIRKIDNLQQGYTRNGDPFQDTTQESQIEDTSNNAPLMPGNEEFPLLLEGEKGSDKNIGLVNPRKVKSSSVVVAPIAPNPERRLYYPSAPVDQPKYRPDNHRYGRAPRETYHYHFANNNSPLRSFDSAPLQPKQMGFPPIANTRENLGKQINWNAKVGRAHRSFYDLMTA